MGVNPPIIVVLVWAAAAFFPTLKTLSDLVARNPRTTGLLRGARPRKQKQHLSVAHAFVNASVLTGLRKLYLVTGSECRRRLPRVSGGHVNTYMVITPFFALAGLRYSHELLRTTLTNNAV